METYVTDKGVSTKYLMTRALTRNETTQQEKRKGNNLIKRQRTGTNTLQWKFKKPQ